MRLADHPSLCDGLLCVAATDGTLEGRRLCVHGMQLADHPGLCDGFLCVVAADVTLEGRWLCVHGMQLADHPGLCDGPLCVAAAVGICWRVDGCVCMACNWLTTLACVTALYVWRLLTVRRRVDWLCCM